MKTRTGKGKHAKTGKKCCSHSSLVKSSHMGYSNFRLVVTGNVRKKTRDRSSGRKTISRCKKVHGRVNQ